MSPPPMSVIIPVYNGVTYLAACLDSVFADPYRPLEVLVVDDGSEDGSGDLAEAYPEVRVIRQSNQGPSAARNAGIAATEGPLVVFLDADDEVISGRFGLHAAFLDAHPETCAVFGREQIVLEQGHDTPAWSKRPDRRFHQPGGVAMMSGMFRRIALERVGGFDTSLRWSEDLDLLFRFNEHEIPYEFTEDGVLRRRIHGRNLTFQTDEIEKALFSSIRGRIERRREAEGRA